MKGMRAADERMRAWLVTGPVGRGLAFAIDFAVALRTMLSQRRDR
jgi:transketolase